MLSIPFRSLAAPAFAAVLRRSVLAALVLCVAGCVSRVPAPVEDRTARPATPPVAKPAAEPDWRPQTYTVKRGDTLYAIALDHGLDYRELAAWNNIENLNVIRVGQVLRLAAPGESTPAVAAGVVTAPLRTVPPIVATDARSAVSTGVPPAAAAGARSTDDYKREPRLVKEPYSEQALRDVQRASAATTAVSAATPAPALASSSALAPAPATAPTAAPASVSTPASAPAPMVATPPAPTSSSTAPMSTAPGSSADAAPPLATPQSDARPPPGGGADEERVDWMWPAKGKIVTAFSEGASLKGIDIAGTAGQPVAASAGGKVVYAGSGLRGYGKLIIIKHNGTYLSAYAHNRDILVKEGQQVAKGQKIAEMGNTDADQVKLHFEIRRHGKPMDPLRYLPPA